MVVTLHRYCQRYTPGDLTRHDLAELWRIMEAEGLVPIFFHDGGVTDFTDFLFYATSPFNWMYAAKRGQDFIGIGIINGFSASGSVAFGHLCSFKAGRDGSFREAGDLWFQLLASQSPLKTLLACIPGCYRGVRAWSESFGFTLGMVIPEGLCIVRAGKVRTTDACLYIKHLTEKGA